MKIINKQCSYYVYLLIFEARAFFSLLVYTDCHLNVHAVSAQRLISSHVKVST